MSLKPPSTSYGNTAGGVLAGLYPNPTFAVDMATQAELDAAVAGSAHQTRIELFGPSGGDGFQFDTAATYGFPTALTASTWQIYSNLVTAQVAFAQARVVWTPNATGCGIQVVSFDSGPTNEVEMCAFTGSASATPVSPIADITAGLQAIVDLVAADKYIGFKYKGNGSVGPMLYAVWLDVVWGG